MNINRKSPIRPESPDTPVTLKEAGNCLEIRYMGKRHGIAIQKLDKDHGIDLRTGEILEYRHTQNRSQDKASVAQSLRKLRDLINANLSDPRSVLWVTLTYRENMTAPKQLYQDFRLFWMRFNYYLKSNGLPKAEYIAAVEPQERGAWHLHCLFLFPKKAPFIPNSDMAALWGQGFTKTTSLKGIDNHGLYLTAYLGDMELDSALAAGGVPGDIVEVETRDEHGNRRKKAIAKGARLRLYPPGLNLYRHSRGVKLPRITETTEAQAQKIVGDAPLVYEKTLSLTDDDGTMLNFINYRQYNRAKK